MRAYRRAPGAPHSRGLRRFSARRRLLALLGSAHPHRSDPRARTQAPTAQLRSAPLPLRLRSVVLGRRPRASAPASSRECANSCSNRPAERPSRVPARPSAPAARRLTRLVHRAWSAPIPVAVLHIVPWPIRSATFAFETRTRAIQLTRETYSQLRILTTITSRVEFLGRSFPSIETRKPRSCKPYLVILIQISKSLLRGLEAPRPISYTVTCEPPQCQKRTMFKRRQVFEHILHPSMRS